MLKIISCKSESEGYRQATKLKVDFLKFKNLKPRVFSDCNLEEAISKAEDISIFGDIDLFYIKIKIGNRGVLAEEIAETLSQNFFQSLERSTHFFVLLGYGAEFEKLVKSFGFNFLKIEEEKTNDFPSDLVTALQKGDKKNSWNLLLRELANKDAEPLHGSCVFAYKTLLVYMNDPKTNSANSGVKDFSWKQAKANALTGKREKQEVTDKYFNLVLAYHKARNGELDLGKQLEKWVLEN